MSDTMLFGVLKMPFEMAMKDEISRLQYYARVQELVGRFEAQQQAEPVADEAIHAAWSAGYVEGEKAALEQQAQPVPRWDVDEDNPDSLAKHPAFQAALEQQAEPPQRQWVGLTDEEIKHEWEVWRANLPRYVGFAKAIEAKLKELNHG